jgi:photosystem II stability/assembly factor-like uncharacterized protein
MPNLAVEDIQFKPGDANTVFAGAGDDNLYISGDTGATWNQRDCAPLTPAPCRVLIKDTVCGDGRCDQDNQGGQVDRIRIDPINPSNMYVVRQSIFSGLGVYKSTDAGLTWSKVLGPNSKDGTAGQNDLAMDQRYPNELYAVLNNLGIFKTTDGGLTWSPLNGPTSGLPSTIVEGAIGVARTNTDTRKVVYAALMDSSGAPGFYVSTDGGSQWTLQCGTSNQSTCVVDLVKAPSEPTIFFCCLGDHDGEIVVDPIDDTIVYYTNFNRLYKSTNSGQLLTAKPQHHVDQQSFAMQLVQPGNIRRLWAGNDGGLEKVTLTDPAAIPGGNDWEDIRKLPVTQFYGLAVASNNPNLVFGATQDNFVNRYTGDAQNWQLLPQCGDATGVVIDPVNPNTVYARCQNGFDVSLDGGNSWYGGSSGLDTTNLLAKAQTGVFRGAEGSLYAGGDRVHKSHRGDDPTSGRLEHYFMNATDVLTFPTGAKINQWVYIPRDTPPREIMLQFATTDGSFEHRAYWGEDLITYGQPGCPSRCSIGAIPSQRDRWVKLTVDAAAIDLVGRSAHGLAYLLYDGAVYWDQTAIEGGRTWVDDALPAGAQAFSSPPDSWTWDTTKFKSGTRSHKSTPLPLYWRPISPVLKPGNGLTAAASSWTNADRVYAAFGNPSSGFGGYMFRTDNGGRKWIAIASPVPNQYITAMAVDPFNDNVVYVTLGGSGISHIWKTKDAGLSWINVSESLPADHRDVQYNDIAVSPLDSKRVVAVDNIGGVFQTLNADLDAGMTWSAAGDLSTLPNTIISGVAFEVGVDITVSTYGRSMWRLPGSAP